MCGKCASNQSPRSRLAQRPPSGEAALQLGNDLCVAGIDRAEFDPAHVRTGVTDPDCQVLHLRTPAQTLEPFDGGDTFGEQIFAKAKVVECGLFEAIQIDMIE